MNSEEPPISQPAARRQAAPDVLVPAPLGAEARARIIARNNVRVSGQGRQAMLFAHGFGTDQKLWRLIAPAFEDRYRVVRFDYVGSGAANHEEHLAERYATLAGYVHDMLDVCRALELEDVILVSHSVSGMVGILGSILRPELFERLLLIAPSARYLNDPPDYIGGFDRDEVDALLEMMDQNFLGWANTFANIAAKDPGLARELFDSFSSADPRTARRFAQVTFLADVRSELGRVSVPSLILQCEDDDIVPPPAGEYLRDHLPGCEYRVLPVAGHCPQISAPEIIIAAINEHLAHSRAAGDSRAARGGVTESHSVAASDISR